MTTKTTSRRSAVSVCLLTLALSAATATGQSSPPAQTFTIWQLPSQTPSQNMSYVLRSRGGEIVVIDGGNKGDAEYLRGFLGAVGNHVNAWFVSHPHPDHVDALTVLLSSPRSPEIQRIFASMPHEEWVAVHEPEPPTHLQSVQRFNAAVRKSGTVLQDVSLGQTIDIDGLHIEVLGIRNPEITSNAINNSSIVLRFSDDHKSVLFTGDLGVEGGHKLLKTESAKRLRSDYVQMAHHGQAGVDINFYSAVRPRFCLWPTPAWLWDNDSGNGKGSGPWQTISVREWMERLNVEQHYVSSRGLIRID